MSNIEYSVAEAKKHFSELLSRVAFRGERITISKRGKPLAILVPPLQNPLRITPAKWKDGWKTATPSLRS